MGILSGIVSYLFGLTLNLLDSAIDGFLGALGFDLSTFETYFPAAQDYYEVIIGLGIGLLFIMLIFQLFRNFGIVLDMEVEDPLKMIGKAALFFGMIINARSITNLILTLLADPYTIFLGVSSTPYEFKLMTLATAMLTGVFVNPFMAVVALILMLVLGWQFLKLTVECVERYIVFYFVLYTAPVVFSTGAFKTTAQIFKSWCRMLASQALLLLLNIWSIKLFLSYLPVLESGADQIVFHFLIGYAFLKFAQKADTLLRILGLNTASTGDMMRSLGGTLASIAYTVKAMGGMAGQVASAAGKLFGGTASATAGHTAAGAAGNTVSGMAGAAAAAGGGSFTTGSGSVTASGMSAAKQVYVNDVLNSAKTQMSENSENAAPMGSDESAHRQDESLRYAETSEGGLYDTLQAAQSGENPISGIDAETREGLSNIAHGLPHDSYDPVKKTFSGGGFPEFTGTNANMIGASQLAPADGFEQYGVKMRDGSMGTLYQNRETGEAHLVQFGSVDNGVIQGAISELDAKTGQLGDFMAFEAVHQSVPGAESFSSHSVPISDGEEGVYHISTGASTSFFASGGGSAMSGTAGGNPSATGAVTAMQAEGGIEHAAPPHTTVSAHETGTIHTSSIGVSAASPTGDTLTASGVSGVGGDVRSAPDSAPAVPSPETPTAFHDTVHSQTPSSASPTVDTKMRQGPGAMRRFSKNNPANLEVFRREAGGVESFDRTAPPNSIPNMDPTNNK